MSVQSYVNEHPDDVSVEGVDSPTIVTNEIPSSVKSVIKSLSNETGIDVIYFNQVIEFIFGLRTGFARQATYKCFESCIYLFEHQSDLGISGANLEKLNELYQFVLKNLASIDYNDALLDSDNIKIKKMIVDKKVYNVELLTNYFSNYFNVEKIKNHPELIFSGDFIDILSLCIEKKVEGVVYQVLGDVDYVLSFVNGFFNNKSFLNLTSNMSLDRFNVLIHMLNVICEVETGIIDPLQSNVNDLFNYMIDNKCDRQKILSLLNFKYFGINFNDITVINDPVIFSKLIYKYNLNNITAMKLFDSYLQKGMTTESLVNLVNHLDVFLRVEAGKKYNFEVILSPVEQDVYNFVTRDFSRAVKALFGDRVSDDVIVKAIQRVHLLNKESFDAVNPLVDAAGFNNIRGSYIGLYGILNYPSLVDAVFHEMIHDLSRVSSSISGVDDGSRQFLGINESLTDFFAFEIGDFLKVKDNQNRISGYQYGVRGIRKLIELIPIDVFYDAYFVHHNLDEVQRLCEAYGGDFKEICIVFNKLCDESVLDKEKNEKLEKLEREIMQMIQSRDMQLSQNRGAIKK